MPRRSFRSPFILGTSDVAENVNLFDFHRSNEVPIALGRVTIAWNNVSHAVFTMYHLLSGLDEEAAKATFFCIASDRAQRDMTEQLVKLKLEPRDPKLGKRAKSILKEINKLAGRRNDFIHVVFMDDHNPEAVKPFYPRGSIKEKVGQELIDSMHKLTIECLDSAIALLKVTSEAQKRVRNIGLITQALLKASPLQGAEQLASHGRYGLLNSFTDTPISPEKDEDQ